MGKWSSRQNTTNHSESSSSLGKWNLCVGLSKSASWNCCYSLRVTCRRGQKYGWVRQKIAMIKMWFSWFFSLHVSFILFHVQSFLWSDCYDKLQISTSFFADILTLYITFPVPAFHGTDVVLIMKALRILEGLGKVSVLAYSNNYFETSKPFVTATWRCFSTTNTIAVHRSERRYSGRRRCEVPCLERALSSQAVKLMQLQLFWEVSGLRDFQRKSMFCPRPLICWAVKRILFGVERSGCESDVASSYRDSSPRSLLSLIVAWLFASWLLEI